MSVDITGRETGCIFKCGQPEDIYMLRVEMNRDIDGTLHAQQDHLNHAVRVPGYAHADCYKEWYEKTYGVPFTMTP